MDIAAFLRQQLDTGLTRAELARRIGVHQSYITRWLSGTLPEVAQCHQIADALGVPRSVVLQIAGREQAGESSADELEPDKVAALATATRFIWEWAGGQSLPVAASVPDKPEVAVEVSTADGKLVITVSVRIELPRRFSARSFESWDVC